MTSALTPHLPFHVDETPWSWAVRLAAVHTGDPPSRFLQDIGVDPRGLMDGDAKALHRLAAVGGADSAMVARNAVERLDGDLARCRGETFDRRFVRWREQRVCPRCVLDDAGGAGGALLSRLRARVAWRLRVVSHYAVHGLPLVDASAEFGFKGGACSAAGRALLRRMRDSAARGSPTFVSPLQRYALDRLDGVAGPAWLDGQRVDLAVRTCEMLGAVALRGARPKISRFTAQDWCEACHLGFAIATDGEAVVHRLLAHSIDAPRSRRISDRHQRADRRACHLAGPVAFPRVGCPGKLASGLASALAAHRSEGRDFACAMGAVLGVLVCFSLKSLVENFAGWQLMAGLTSVLNAPATCTSQGGAGLA